MARLSIPYLVAKSNRAGVRRYWQPSRELRELGWPTVRLAAELGAAADQARRINAALARWKAALAGGARAARPAELVERLQADWHGAAPDALARPGAPAVAPAAAPGTVGAMIDAFMAHHEYTETRPATRRFYRQSLELLRQWAGDMPVQAVTAPALDDFRHRLGRRAKRRATAMVQAVRRLYNWGARQPRFMHLIERNPGARARLDMSPASAPRLWEADELAHMVATADGLGLHSVGTAILLGYWLGQRQGDVLGLAREAWADGWFTLVQSKTGAPAAIPDNPMLAARVRDELDRQRARGLAGVTLLLDERTGAPYDEHAYRRRFGQVRAAAAETLPRCAELQHLHLRHTAVVRLAEAGATTIEVAAITGHTLRQVAAILERYLVRTRALAANAAAKRLQREGE